MNDPMRLFCRHGIWHAEFAGGKRRSLRTTDEQEAKGIFKELEKEYLRGRLLRLDTIKRTSLSDFATAYEQNRVGLSKWTVKKDMLSLKLLREAVGNIDLRTVTTDKISRFKSVCLSRGASPQTVNGYLRHIKAALAYALDGSLIDKKPTIKMVPVNHDDMAERIISPDNLKAILAAADTFNPDFSRYLTVLLWTGARRREILNLTWQAVDLARGSVLLTKTKGRKDRRVPLLPGAILALEPMKKDIGRCFPDWHPDTCSKWFHAITVACGVKARLHDLRHSAATYMLKSGIPIQVVKEILGHANLITTMLYSHLLDDVLRAEMGKMKIE
ncbi:MAG: tyrosine-type recombinase/integrase [Syntrophales bacterium]